MLCILLRKLAHGFNPFRWVLTLSGCKRQYLSQDVSRVVAGEARNVLASRKICAMAIGARERLNFQLPETRFRGIQREGYALRFPRCEVVCDVPHVPR